jgi:hypothetical protein
MSSLPFTLSVADATLFQELQDSALLPSLAKPGEGELVELFKQKKREEQCNIVEPYADLLEINLKGMLKRRLPSILQSLREAKSTVFTADLFSWYTVQYSETISERQARISKMTYEERAKHYLAVSDREEDIAQNGWETMFATRGFWEYTRKDIKVERIFRFSDLKERLSLALGPNFYPHIRTEWVSDVSDQVDDRGFRVYKKVLAVKYYPFGVSADQLKKLLEVAKKQAQRKAEGKITTYEKGEYGVGHAQLSIIPKDTRSSEEEAPSPVPLLGSDPYVHNHCFCGCESDNE